MFGTAPEFKDLSDLHIGFAKIAWATWATPKPDNWRTAKSRIGGAVSGENTVSDSDHNDHTFRNRFVGILWNFRYSNTVRRREDLAVMVHNSRMSISEWLDLLELQQYEGLHDQQFPIETVCYVNQETYRSSAPWTMWWTSRTRS